MSTEQRLRFVDIIRRGYGRRYTWLPVDELDSEGLAANFTDACIRPDHIDIRVGDIARWRDGESYHQARVVEVVRDDLWLRVRFEAVEPILAEIYYS